MKQAKTSTIVLISFTVSGLIAAGLYYFLNETRTSIATLKKTYVNLKKEADELASLQSRYDQFHDSLDKLTNILPGTAVDVATFLEAVNGAARDAGPTLAITVADPTPTNVTPDGALVEITIDIQGTYVNTTKFIDQISNLPYYFIVESVNMLPDQSGTGLTTTIKIALTTTYSI